MPTVADRPVALTGHDQYLFREGTHSRLYEKLGYEREGLRRGHYRRGDELIDAILMAKVVP